MTNYKVSRESTDFINAVVNPFGNQASARVPDIYGGNSVCLTDWADNTPTIGGTAGVNYQGVAWVFLPGYSNLKSTYCNNSSMVYQVASLPIIASTGLIGLTAASKIENLTYVNYSTITGSTTSVDADDCLVDAFRIFAAGLRAWPTTEVVTDTSAVHTTRYFGGCITPNTIFRSIVDGTNFITVMKNSDSIKMFQAQEGVTVRFNPFQTPERILEMNSLANWNMQAHDWSQIEVPIIMALFSQNVTGTSDSAMSYVNSKYLWKVIYHYLLQYTQMHHQST